MNVAGVNVVKYGDVKILGDQQCQSHDAQVRAFFFALSALGQSGRFIEAVNKGIEIRGVVEETGHFDLGTDR